jgi:hypothetical protein
MYWVFFADTNALVTKASNRKEECTVSEIVLKAKSPNLPNWTVNKIFIVLFSI